MTGSRLSTEKHGSKQKAAQNAPDPFNHYLEGFEQGLRDLSRGDACPEDQRNGGHHDYWRGYEYAMSAVPILAVHGHTMKSWMESLK